MKRVTAIATATVLALLVALTLNVAAQQPDTRDRTIMTFSSAVELPGTRLEPGTYVFRLADTASRNVIQVLDESEKEMLGQWLFVSAERPEVTGDTVVTFRETSAASTPAVQYWYYPGEKIGKEFIYPKDQAMRIAQRTGATVQTEEGPVTATGQAEVAVAPAETPSASTSAEASVSADSGIVEGAGVPEQQTTAVGISGSGRQETEVAGTSGRNETEVSGTSGSGGQVASDTGVRQESTIAQADTTADSGAVSELPATASPLALSGLLALLSLAGAAGIRSFRL
jgi:hypothetical protein